MKESLITREAEQEKERLRKLKEIEFYSQVTPLTEEEKEDALHEGRKKKYFHSRENKVG